MILSTNFFTKSVATIVAGLLCLSGCAAINDSASSITENTSAAEKSPNFAVLPVYNLSGTPAPLNEIRDALISSFDNKGLHVIDDEILDNAIARHRIRYIGGVNQATAKALRQDTGAEAVLITAVELYNDIPPPRIALSSRLVSTTNPPEILWMNGTGLAGDDSPGLLELSLVENPQALLKMAVQRLATSLSEFLSGQKGQALAQKARKKFQPKVVYRSPVLSPDMSYRVAVVPFFNISERKHAGNILALHFIRQLLAVENLRVVEPGVVRQALLSMRIIMGDGLSLGDADLVFSRLNADLVLTGKTLDYQDYQGVSGSPKVDFSAQLFERKSREIVWNVKSFNMGHDGVFFFDWGRVNTAHAMAAEMVRLAVEDIIK